MSTLTDTIDNAQHRAAEIRPKVGGFAVLAEVLRQAGMASDRGAVIDALRADQAGHTTFPQFLTAIWCAGVTGLVVELEQRDVTYRGIDNATYVESYPAVEI